MPRKTTTKKKPTKRKSKSVEIKALTKDAGIIYAGLQKDLIALGKKYDLKKMQATEAKGDGFFFVLAKSHSVKKESDFSWSQSNFNFPVAALAATLDEVAQHTIKIELLNLFAQNLGRQFQQEYGEDFVAAITVKFYEFLEQHFGHDPKNT